MRIPVRQWLPTAIAIAAATMLSGCGSSTAEIGQQYTLVDDSGARAGKLIFSPLGSGEVYDSRGRLIGRVVQPY